MKEHIYQYLELIKDVTSLGTDPWNFRYQNVQGESSISKRAGVESLCLLHIMEKQGWFCQLLPPLMSKEIKSLSSSISHLKLLCPLIFPLILPYHFLLWGYILVFMDAGVLHRDIHTAISQKWKWNFLSRVRLFVTPWTTQCKELSKPEYWSG